MTNAHKITLALAVVLAGLLTFAGYGWIKERENTAVLAAQTKINQDAAAVIAARERDNQQQLADAMKAYAALKQQVRTPAQVVRALPQVIKLGEPIRQVTPEQAKAVEDIPDSPQAGDLIIPSIEAKAFYDTQVDCKANETKLAACIATVDNQKQLITVKNTQIKQDHEAIKGGTKMQRFKSAAKWFAIGGITAAVTIAATR